MALSVPIDKLNRLGIKRHDYQFSHRGNERKSSCALAGMLGHRLEIDRESQCLTVADPKQAAEVAAFLARKGVDCSPQLF